VASDICSFPVHLTGQVSASTTAFRDAQGRLLKVHLHFDNTFTLTANGKTVTERNRYNEFDIGFDVTVQPEVVVPTRIVQTGLSSKSSLPGGGVVLVEAGRIVLDAATDTVVFQAGNPRTSGEVAALCNALS
jgi:hypothetical protein